MPETQPGPVALSYHQLVAGGEIESDAAQLALVDRLDGLVAALAEPASGSFLTRLFGRGKADAPRGLYVVGGVGRGKTMLMDMFFDAAPEPKRRAHFHAFMADVHQRVHRARQAGAGDPIPPVAAALLGEARLLCFDEFQVTDIADAMILGRLFEHLFAGGLVMVATSNTAPKDLYRGGLNRALFEPSIAMIEARCEVFELKSRTDFRLEKLKSQPVWITPADEAADRALDAAFQRLAGAPKGRRESLSVQGREVEVPQALHGVARFSFAQLCDEARGPADYLAIAERYHTLVLDRVPVLTAEARNPTRRFVTLVDALYDNRVKLVASADAEPESLVSGGLHAVEFQRTASRLFEMRSQEWLALPHGRDQAPGDADAAVSKALERGQAAG